VSRLLLIIGYTNTLSRVWHSSESRGRIWNFPPHLTTITDIILFPLTTSTSHKKPLLLFAIRIVPLKIAAQSGKLITAAAASSKSTSFFAADHVRTGGATAKNCSSFDCGEKHSTSSHIKAAKTDQHFEPVYKIRRDGRTDGWETGKRWAGRQAGTVTRWAE
jgi:hypothetical protein